MIIYSFDHQVVISSLVDVFFPLEIKTMRASAASNQIGNVKPTQS